ncbi:DUF2877 domain-containing protein [Myxococcota bacterium]|nr:DUF2877 domain-containing protein [Myxococcota bacterium]MBU1381241.1 DUF2877 domain-containing protein [Myxococcota bacterium]MBU1498877.1 DUF2877 domain-containing protein [Myxococcota bacterium]
MKILSIGDKVLCGTYSFHSGFTHVVNYRNYNCIISFVDKDSFISGRAIRTSSIPRCVLPVRIDPSGIFISDSIYPTHTAKIYDSSFSGFSSRRDVELLILLIKSTLRTSSPSLSLAVLFEDSLKSTFSSTFEKAILCRFLSAYDSLKSGDVSKCVEQFKGVGFGLTPSGDDFITGLLYAFSSVADSDELTQIKNNILRTAENCSPLSFEFMKSAASGSYPIDIKDLFLAALTKDIDLINKAILNILKHGHSSGADTAAGIVAGFEWLLKKYSIETEAIRIRG